MASAFRALFLSRTLHAGAASRGIPSTLLHPLTAAARLLSSAPGAGVRRFATQPAPATSSPPQDSSSPPIWRPPREGFLFHGRDFEHWLVYTDPPPGDAANPDVPRDAIIDGYVKTLALVVGSEEEARRKIYSVSTRHYFAFGALLPEEFYWKLRELPMVVHVSPDWYMDVESKSYGGEPFVNGEAVPYDPKYHEEYLRLPQPERMCRRPWRRQSCRRRQRRRLYQEYLIRNHIRMEPFAV